ncbi:MAG: hypothetical protein RKE49_07385 [Oceanicaulis sp.]
MARRNVTGGSISDPVIDHPSALSFIGWNSGATCAGAPIASAAQPANAFAVTPSSEIRSIRIVFSNSLDANVASHY